MFRDFVDGKVDSAGHPLNARVMNAEELCGDVVLRGACEGRLDGAAQRGELATVSMLPLGRRTAMERVASFLLDLHASSCPKTTTGVLKLPMTRADIADFLGLTLETVSRAFSRLKSLGVIRLPSAQEVELRDTERLKALAGSTGL